MCQETEILIVCFAKKCLSEKNGIRLPLLCLIPTPESLYYLCEKAKGVGYRTNGSLLGLPLMTIYPDECPDVANADKFRLCLSHAVSRETSQRAGFLIQCKECCNTGHAQNHTLSDRPGNFPKFNSRPLAFPAESSAESSTEFPPKNKYFTSDWTCCAVGECSDDDLCQYRVAALLCGMSTQSREAEQAIIDTCNQETDEGYDGDVSDNST
ncbi:hypothetical protein BDP55DRAFT_728220 [Colletotrichum godetiae]|uniref:Uncharacterized protein n=1 Tax=Colletotrichum godetiae TaxID=1209918 RepID=A0AAJ0AM27_9PEZI|nr:uncharacterized protein BDP55DRAFT_728220 [Colletotrichum godetiae]KAK1676398.1 hypothetical protein BDP55DRAFT_728220 [Colletotrichum godetiae]